MITLAKIIDESELLAQATEFATDEILNNELTVDFALLLIRNSITVAWMVEVLL